MNQQSETGNIQDTLSTRLESHVAGNAIILKITVLWHPDESLTGHTCTVQFDKRDCFELSRFSPEFFSSTGGQSSPLAWAGVSRKPVRMFHSEDGCRLVAPESRMRLQLGAQQVENEVLIDQEQLKQGQYIILGDQIVLWLQYSRYLATEVDECSDFLGVSDAARRVRDLVRQYGSTDADVLIRGETGTGKELVARELFSRSKRSASSFLAVNMATLNDSLAAAELFGAVKGAYTGASRDKRGLFQSADKGTLFLDEIGDTPPAVQPMLLRAIENGEVRAVGSLRNSQVDVRIIAATDQILETDSLTQSGSFNQPLLRRLESLEIRIPALVSRKQDIGLMVRHFFRGFRQAHKREALKPIELSEMVQMLEYNWPGNVRELRNRLQSLFLTGELNLPLGETVRTEQQSVTNKYGRRMSDRSVVNEPRRQTVEYRDPNTVTDRELVDALEHSDWIIKSAAIALNVSRTSFYSLLQQCEAIRDVTMIGDDEIVESLNAHQGDLTACARSLKTPREGLKNRIRKAGLSTVQR